MNILLHVFSNSEHDNGDYDYAVLRLTEEVAKNLSTEMRKLRELRENHSDLIQLVFEESGDCLSFYSNGIFTKNKQNVVSATNTDDFSLEAMLTPEEEAHWEDNQWCILRDSFILPPQEEELPYENCYRTIHAEGFYWEAHPPYLGTLILETYMLGEEILSKVM